MKLDSANLAAAFEMSMNEARIEQVKEAESRPTLRSIWAIVACKLPSAGLEIRLAFEDEHRKDPQIAITTENGTFRLEISPNGDGSFNTSRIWTAQKNGTPSFVNSTPYTEPRGVVEQLGHFFVKHAIKYGMPNTYL